MAFLERAKQIAAPPPPGSPYSIALPESAQPGRSPVYRHWRFQDELLRTLDPDVSIPMFRDSNEGSGYSHVDRFTLLIRLSKQLVCTVLSSEAVH